MKILVAGYQHETNTFAPTLADWAAFNTARRGRLILATTRGAVDLWQARFQSDDVLLFGSEGAGVPDHVHETADLAVRIPLRPGMRSLNVAISAGIMLAESLRQTSRALPSP